MFIKDMFVKSIERPIKGVIKVAQTDDENTHQELDEYVVTQEIYERLSKFYGNYEKGIDGKTDKMGVWISGFFGSGKSHFLKILSYLLDNKGIKGKKALDYFDGKIQDPLLLGNMKRIGNVDTEVILFNIDSKSSIGGKSKEDAILKVFTKVFYEHRGFYGGNPGVAEMEKYLSKEGKFDTFKASFKRIKGDEWVNRRRTFRFDADAVVGALTEATGMSEESAREWFKNGVNDYVMSIEKFAQDVKEYIDSKGPKFHLVFLVDEIGQYIGGESKLMLNLQTITEDLGTYCQGRVWIMVTSQESIDDLFKVKGNDFSKITGRFDTRLSLSSISVDEVIKKRILEKNETATDTLKILYHDKAAILKNLISFKDSATDLLGFECQQDFIDVYPFVPYQFKLLQNVFEQIRKHGSSGKHLSEGERSMLSAFKESALKYKEAEDGTLIPFYAFYETIKEFLNPAVVRVIEGAYKNPALKDDDFNMELLKVLFMVKYIKELPANVDNIATLMITHIDEDKLALKEKIKTSLGKLTRETLIQKNADVYIFLTDDEQDINREIKIINIDDDIIKKELRTYIFEEFYEDKKFRYSKQYNFSFNKKMDEKEHGNQTAHIGIHILSPKSDLYDQADTNLIMRTAGSGEMIVKLGGNGFYMEELEEALKIDEYTKRKNISQLPENIQNIINNKKAEERVRRLRAKENLENALKDATFFINGQKEEIKGSSVKEKINAGLKILVETVYSKLSYVKVFCEDTRELLNLINSDFEQTNIDGFEKSDNSLATGEIFEFIKIQDDINKQVRVKILIDRFSDKPYGWREFDISALIATLLKEQRIRLKLNSEYLEIGDPNLISGLTKASDIDRVIVTKRVKVDEALIRSAKNVCKELWNTTDIADDEDGLAKDIKALIRAQVEEINALKNRYEGRKYPGESLLDKGLEYFEAFRFLGDNASLFLKLQEMEEDLLTWEEDFSYVKNFFDNQKAIFDKGLEAAKKFEDNKLYLSEGDVNENATKLNDILNHYLPYGRIKEIPEYVKVINEGINRVVEQKKAEATDKINADFENMKLKINQYGVKEDTKERINKFYNDLLSGLSGYNDIYKVDATITHSSNFRTRNETIIEDEIKQFNEELKKGDNTVTKEKPEEADPVVEEIKLNRYISIRTIKTEAEVDVFVKELSEKLKAVIRNNKQIKFSE